MREEQFFVISWCINYFTYDVTQIVSYYHRNILAVRTMLANPKCVCQLLSKFSKGFQTKLRMHANKFSEIEKNWFHQFISDGLSFWILVYSFPQKIVTLRHPVMVPLLCNIFTNCHFTPYTINQHISFKKRIKCAQPAKRCLLACASLKCVVMRHCSSVDMKQ